MINYIRYIYNKNEQNKILYGANFHNYFNITQKNALENVLKYDSKYIFGKFTKVFAPSQTNDTIATKMEDIINKVNEHKPVFLIGYGASGAGKTSTLIYNNKEKTPGILVEICNHLCKQSSPNPRYNKIELLVKEYYITNLLDEKKTCNGDNTIQNPYICSGEVYNFKVEDQKIILDGNFNSDPKHPYRTNKLKELELIEKTVGKSFGEVMMYLVDSDRYVKATTNNPNSSRSHTLIFVKLVSNDENTQKNGHIVVGDFAGVENVFTCENYETINAFLNQTRDGDTKPYYSTENDEIEFAKFGDNTKYLKGVEVIDTTGFNKKMNDFKVMIANQQNVSSLPDIFKNKNNPKDPYANSFIENWESIKDIVNTHTDQNNLKQITTNINNINNYKKLENDYLISLEKYLHEKYITSGKDAKNNLINTNNDGKTLLTFMKPIFISTTYYIENYIDRAKPGKPIKMTMATGNNRPPEEYSSNIKYMEKFIKIFLQINIGDIIENFRNKNILYEIEPDKYYVDRGQYQSQDEKLIDKQKKYFKINYVNMNSNELEQNKNKKKYNVAINVLTNLTNTSGIIDNYINIKTGNTYDKKLDQTYGTNFYNLLDIKNYEASNKSNKYVEMITAFIEYIN